MTDIEHVQYGKMTANIDKLELPGIVTGTV